MEEILIVIMVVIAFGLSIIGLMLTLTLYIVKKVDDLLLILLSKSELLERLKEREINNEEYLGISQILKKGKGEIAGKDDVLTPEELIYAGMVLRELVKGKIKS